jgi:hypothetical protein
MAEQSAQWLLSGPASLQIKQEALLLLLVLLLLLLVCCSHLVAPVCCASASTKRLVMRQKRSWSPLLGKMGPEMGSAAGAQIAAYNIVHERQLFGSEPLVRPAGLVQAAKAAWL